MHEVLTVLSNIFIAISVVALIGIFKPFIGNFTRKHFVIAFFAFLIVGSLIQPAPTPEQLRQEKADLEKQALEDKQEKEAKAAEEAESKLNTLRLTMAYAAKSAITEAARNPDSVSFAYVGVSEDASLVCVRYRAQNGFGGMNVDTVAFLNGVPKESASFWNKRCANTNLYTY